MSFAENLHNHLLSGIGVTAVRTRDPMATALEVSAFCLAQDRPFMLWDAARGYVTDPDPVTGSGDGRRNLSACFAEVLTPGSEVSRDAVILYTMVHHAISPQRPNPELLQLLVLMAHGLPLQRRRVVLTIPPGFTMPNELAELVPVIDHDAPGLGELGDCIENVFQDFADYQSDSLPTLDDDGKRRLAQAGAGMIRPEFESALARVLFNAMTKRERLDAEQVRTRMLHEKASMVKRNNALEVMPSVPVEQVGGLVPLKRWLEQRRASMDPEAWAQGVDKAKGCALVGPPGTGKSLVGKVIGSMLGIATIRFDVSAVFSGLVGSSEQNMREALFLIKSLAPCVVLLDEVDKVFSTGPSGDSGVSQKVFGALLTFMQENDAPIFWVPTLNRTENVPAEFLRAGRVDEVFGVSVPTAVEREEILRIHLSKRQVDVDAIGDLSEAVEVTDRFVGAEIEGVASAAKLAAYNEGTDVRLDHIVRAARATRPLSRRMADQFEAMEAWCKMNAAPANAPAEQARSRARSRRRVDPSAPGALAVNRRRVN